MGNERIPINAGTPPSPYGRGHLTPREVPFVILGMGQVDRTVSSSSLFFF